MRWQAKYRKRRTWVGLEALEDRAVPATFGVPWHDASHLSLSFAPDGTGIVDHVSTLFQTLNAQEPTAVWQRQILRAFQTWAVNANINIGLVADGGQAFGTAGPPQGDSRFGDVRIGAQAMSPESLSISVPNDPSLASTWTGDVLLNSNDVFNSSHLDLVAVMMHEAGHVFGLSDSTDPKSPLYSQYRDNTQLTSADIAALQGLYGTRAPDSHEGSGGNNSISSATQVPFPGSYTGATPLVMYGDITTNKDVDFFAVKPLSNYSGPITFRLQTAGISLMNPHLTVLDAKGNVLGDAQASSGLGDVVTVHLNSSSPNATYYVEVQGATNDVFGIGSYALATTFDATSTVSPSALDSVMRGPYGSLSQSDIAALFTSPSTTLLNNDLGADDEPTSATTLTALPGYARNSVYRTIASISSPTDTDFYRIQTADNPPNGQTLVLTATVRSLYVNGTAPRVAIIDGDGTVVKTQILANGNGTFTVQAAGLKGGGWFLLEVSPGSSSSSAVGNYALDAEFGTAAANFTTFASNTLSATTTQRTANFYVAESQLFQFLLSANAAGAPAGTGVQMTILDSAGNVVFTLGAGAGDTTSGNTLFLTPGAYTLRITAVGDLSTLGGGLGFTLSGEAISDPIGPDVSDPALSPLYTSTTPGVYVYPGDIVTTSSYLITASA